MVTSFQVDLSLDRLNTIGILLRSTPDRVNVFSACVLEGVRETLWKEVGDPDSGPSHA